MITRLTLVSAFALILLLTAVRANARPACDAAFPRPAAAIALFTKEGGFVPGYRDLVERLGPGSRIQLPDGSEFEIHGVTGGGQLTKIFDLGDGWLLRIAAGDGTRRSSNEIEATEPEFIRGMTSFSRVHDEIESAGVPVVEVDRQRTQLPYAIVVKKLNFVFEGPEFVQALKYPERSRLAPELVMRAREDFLKFMDRTFLFESIGDFGVRQLGYTGKEWVLFDMGEVSQMALHRPLSNFESDRFPLKALSGKDDDGKFTLRELPAELEMEVAKRIRKLRKQLRLKGEWYTRSGPSEAALVTALKPHPLAEGSTLPLSAESAQVRRLTRGLWPKAQAHSAIKVVRFIKEKKDVARYEVRVENAGETFYADLYLAKTSQAEKRLFKLREKFNDDPSLVGDDFILVYREEDRPRLVERRLPTRPIFR